MDQSAFRTAIWERKRLDYDYVLEMLDFEGRTSIEPVLSCDGLSNVFLEALNEFLDLFMDQTFH
jgi:hypothetical protein